VRFDAVDFLRGLHESRAETRPLGGYSRILAQASYAPPGPTEAPLSGDCDYVPPGWSPLDWARELECRAAQCADPDAARSYRDRVDCLLVPLGSVWLPPEWRTFYKKRSAALEQQDGHPREHAEARAMSEVIAAMRGAEESPFSEST
jgi:hypothetical protein